MRRSIMFIACAAALCGVAAAQWRSDKQRQPRRRPAEAAAVTPAHDFDPLVGAWKCVNDYGMFGEAGTIVRVKYDSLDGEYAGYLLVPSDSMAARGRWSAGDVRWRNYRYAPDPYGRDYSWHYEGLVVQRRWEQVTPAREAYVDRGIPCTLEVITLSSSDEHEGWFRRVVGDTALILTCDGYLQEVWDKVK